MATWHQQKNRTPLWHDTKWTVVIDPPNECLCVVRFDTAKEANEYAAKIKHAYTIQPASAIRAQAGSRRVAI